MNFRKNRVFLSKTATSNATNNNTNTNKTIEDNFLGKMSQLQASASNSFIDIQAILTTGLGDILLR